jgi:protease I
VWTLPEVALEQGGEWSGRAPATRGDVTNAGGTSVDQVVGGNRSISRKPDDLPAFVAALMEQMRKG